MICAHRRQVRHGVSSRGPLHLRHRRVRPNRPARPYDAEPSTRRVSATTKSVPAPHDRPRREGQNGNSALPTGAQDVGASAADPAAQASGAELTSFSRCGGRGDRSTRHVTARAHRGENRTRWSAQGSFEQAKGWQRLNLWFGLLAAGSAAVSGAPVLASSGLDIVGGLLALWPASCPRPRTRLR